MIRKPVIDHERREVRQGRWPPIPFREIDRVHIYRDLRDEKLPWWMHLLTSIGKSNKSVLQGKEYWYVVSIWAGEQQMILDEFDLRREAEEYAEQIRAMIAARPRAASGGASGAVNTAEGAAEALAYGSAAVFTAVWRARMRCTGQSTSEGR